MTPMVGEAVLTWTLIEGGLTNAWTLVSSGLDFIASQPALIAMFAAGLIPIGFRIFRKAKRAVKG